MTTIAYKDGVIAYDGQITQGDIIKTKDDDKHREVNGVHFFLSGSQASRDILVDSWFAGKNCAQDSDVLSVSAFVVDVKSNLFECGFDEDRKFVITPLRKDICDARGSGEQFALAAMDMGADAETAVRIAAGRDIYTGGKIRTFKVHAS